MALEAAVELDRLRRGKDADRSALADFVQGLIAPQGGSLSDKPLHLHYSPRTVDAYYRAAPSLLGSQLDSLEGLKDILDGILGQIGPAFADPSKYKDDPEMGSSILKLESFCLALHRALSADRPRPRWRIEHRDAQLAKAQ